MFFHAVKCLNLVIFYVKWRWKIQLFNNLTESNFRFGEFGTFSVSKKVQNLILQLLKLPKILISQIIQIAVISESRFATYFSQIQSFFTLTYQISVISRKISAAFIWGIFWFSPRFVLHWIFRKNTKFHRNFQIFNFCKQTRLRRFVLK